MFRKEIFSIIIFCMGCLTVHGQQSSYNKALADSLGADDYGMKKYVLVMLKTAPNTSVSRDQMDSCFRGHMNNIKRMVEMKKLIVAGPLLENDNHYEGIFILDVKTIDEAKALLQNDPAVKQDLLEPEYYVWYGSAALPTYLPYHSKIEKKEH